MESVVKKRAGFLAEGELGGHNPQFSRPIRRVPDSRKLDISPFDRRASDRLAVQLQVGRTGCFDSRCHICSSGLCMAPRPAYQEDEDLLELVLFTPGHLPPRIDPLNTGLR